MFFLQERQGTEDAHPSAMLCTTRFAMRSAPTRLSERVSISSKAIAKWDVKNAQMVANGDEREKNSACVPSIWPAEQNNILCVAERRDRF